MANSYKVLAVKRVEDAVITDVEYNFSGRLVRTPVSHFRPATRQEVGQGIRNRGASELAKLTAADAIDGLLVGFVVGEDTPIP
jgi:hypothetical protein